MTLKINTSSYKANVLASLGCLLVAAVVFGIAYKRGVNLASLTTATGGDAKRPSAAILSRTTVSPTHESPQASLSRKVEFDELDAGSDAADESAWPTKLRAFPSGHVPSGGRQRAFERWTHMTAGLRVATSPATPQWTFRGPEPETGVMAGSGSSVNPCSGRVTAVAISPASPATIYIGAAGGGVWKTVDGGTTWNPLTDFASSLSIGALAIDPSDANTIYAGTGEQNHSHDEYSGVGILKSTDGGAHWSLLAAGVFSGQTIGSLAISPSDSQIIMAAARGGIYRSVNAGSNWTRVLPSDTSADVVVFDPANSEVVYASVGEGSSAYTGVYKSSDSGVTWQRINGTGTAALPVAQAGRIALAVSYPPNVFLYAGLASSDGTSMLGFFKSSDGGTTWTKMSSSAYCPVQSGRNTGQCFYNNVVAVSPTHPDTLLAGGINLWSSTNGGADWTSVTNLHSDQHAVAFSSDGSHVFVGDDGGVYTSDAAQATYSFTSLNNTLAIAQFYPGLSIHPSNSGITFAGTQDNNVLAFNGGLSWTSVSPGDGAATAIDPRQPANVYLTIAGSSAQTHPIYKSTQGGLPGTFNASHNGIDLTETLPFPEYLAIDPGQPANLYFTGKTQLYQSTNSAAGWTKILPDLTGGSADLCTIAVAPSDSNTVYTGSCDGIVSVTRNALLGTSVTWTRISSGLPVRAVTHIEVAPASPTTAYVTVSGFYSGHVFLTNNAGRTWSDISNNLPDISANALVIDPDLPDTLFVATDLGVYYQ